MFTKDPTLVKWFGDYGVASARVYGFLCGYNTTFGKGRDHMDSPEYRQGWEEGKGLRFDEMVASARGQGWRV